MIFGILPFNNRFKIIAAATKKIPPEKQSNQTLCHWQLFSLVRCDFVLYQMEFSGHAVLSSLHNHKLGQKERYEGVFEEWKIVILQECHHWHLGYLIHQRYYHHFFWAFPTKFYVCLTHLESVCMWEVDYSLCFDL